MLNLERQDNGTIKKKFLCHNFDLNRVAYPFTGIKERHKSKENVIRGEQYCPQKNQIFYKMQWIYNHEKLLLLYKSNIESYSEDQIRKYIYIFYWLLRKNSS